MGNVILALPAECWRWIPGYEGWYQVSTRGRVRSVDRWVTYSDGKKYFYKGRILKPRRSNNGYLLVGLNRNGIQSQLLIHRLVLEVWGDGNPENKPQVNHRDEDKSNNSVENLSWASAKENANFGTRNKRLSKAVLALDPKTGQVVKEFSSGMEAERNGFDSGHISLCCQGKRYKTHRGLVWRYKDDYDQEKTWAPVKIGAAASLSKPVQAINPSTGEVVLEFPSIKEALRNGFNQWHIWSCCRGKLKTHRGYIWRYKG